MQRRIILLLTALLLSTTLSTAQRREVHILGVNDIHSAVDEMPMLAHIADSLRALYPELLVLSAGDNRTGNPINDIYEPSGYPMVALMNQIGFDASAVGNHEFDVNSLATLCPLSTFPYLCANMTADDTTGVRVRPYKLFDVGGLKVAIVGAVQISSQGYPDAHPRFLRGMHFESPFDVVPRYEWLSRECDATILLSHVGYQDDILLAEKCPWIDLIVGGHTHRQLSENEPLHNGVLITQNRNGLNQATHITLTVDSGRVVEKKAEYLLVGSLKQKNHVVEMMVQHFNANPYFKRVLAQAETPFQLRSEVGTMVCDAIRDATGTDIAIVNYRGIRVRKLPAGDITVGDVLAIDPFDNHIVTTTMTGAEQERFLMDYGNMNVYRFPHLSGMSARLEVDRDEPADIQRVTLLGPDGRRFDRKRTYRVATVTYVVARGGKYAPTNVEELDLTTSNVIMNYLEKQKSISYQGRGTLKYVPVKVKKDKKK